MSEKIDRLKEANDWADNETRKEQVTHINGESPGEWIRYNGTVMDV